MAMPQPRSDTIYDMEAAKWVPVLAPLRPLFEPNGFVHLHHCYAGQCRAILVHMARALGVPVYGGMDQENPIVGYNRGSFVVGLPAGGCREGLPRPH